MLYAILAYVLLQLLIGFLVSRNIKTEDDYLVGGRRLGPVFAASSIFATWFGAETCLSASAGVQREGLGWTTTEPFAYGICLLLMGLIFAAPFWRSRVTTLADLFRRRFGPRVETVAALVLIPTSVFWAAAQIHAFGQVLASESSLSVPWAIGLAAGIAIIYTVFGGFLADVYTDFIQGGVLVVGLVVILWMLLRESGGFAAAAAHIPAGKVDFGIPEDMSLLDLIEMWAIPVCGSVVAQEAVQRALASRSAGVARTAGLAGGGFYVLIGSIPVFLALAGGYLVPEPASSESFLSELAHRILGGGLLYVLFAGALVSAILSTVDSTLLVAASLASRNLVGRWAGESERRRVLVARGAVLLFGLAAWALANTSERAMELVEDASGFGSASILVLVVFGLFSKIGGRLAGLLCLFGGLGSWIQGNYYEAGLSPEHPYLASLLVALVAFLLGSGLDRLLQRPEA